MKSLQKILLAPFACLAGCLVMAAAGVLLCGILFAACAGCVLVSPLRISVASPPPIHFALAASSTDSVWPALLREARVVRPEIVGYRIDGSRLWPSGERRGTIALEVSDAPLSGSETRAILEEAADRLVASGEIESSALHFQEQPIPRRVNVTVGTFSRSQASTSVRR